MARPFSDEFVLENAKTQYALNKTIPPDLLDLTEELFGEREERTKAEDNAAVERKRADDAECRLDEETNRADAAEKERDDLRKRIDEGDTKDETTNLRNKLDKLTEEVMKAVRKLKDVSPGYDSRAAKVAYELSVAVTEAEE